MGVMIIKPRDSRNGYIVESIVVLFFIAIFVGIPVFLAFKFLSL